MGRVADKIALVTGGASGLGRASATMLAREGARVLLTDIDEDGGRAVASELGRNAAFLRQDVTSEADWAQAIGTAQERFGGLNVLVNNAGIGILRDIERTSMEEWRQVHAVNLDSVYLGCKLALPVMRRSQPASIINISSVSGLRGGHNLAAYNSSKGAVRLLTKSVALHCARGGDDIRCNSIHPAFVETPILQGLLHSAPDQAAARRKLIDQIPVRRLGRPEDVGYAVLYLASQESHFMTGAELVLDGGMTA